MEHARQAEEYLKCAEECALTAKLATTEEAKNIYIRMAELFHGLADQETKLMGTGSPLVADLIQRTCIRCGGKSFIHTPIMDTTTGRMQHMFRCRACDNQQWTTEPDK
jgi:hypothetical protein